jgi:hypothetical protein
MAIEPTPLSNPSIIDFLNAINQPSSYPDREMLAKKYGIQNYTGLDHQNEDLLELLRNEYTQTGKIGFPATSTPATPPEASETPAAEVAPEGSTGPVPTVVSSLEDLNLKIRLIGGLPPLTQEQYDAQIAEKGFVTVSGTFAGETNPDGSAVTSKNYVIGEVSPAADTGISPSDSKEEDADTNLDIDPWATGIPSEILNLGIFGLPREAWPSIIPQLRPGSPEHDAAMAQVETGIYDVLQQQMIAATEQEKVAADYEWETLRGYIKDNLNIVLSQNAIQGWDQLQAIKREYATQNLQGSGIQAEAMDDYLKKVRASDVAQRQIAESKEGEGRLAYLKNYASDQEIRDLLVTDPELAKLFTPSTDVAKAYTTAALKAKMPGWTNEEIGREQAALLHYDIHGQNPLYRSKLSQEELYGIKRGITESTPNIQRDVYGNIIDISVPIADTGIEDIKEASRKYKAAVASAKLYTDFLAANPYLKRDYEEGDDPFEIDPAPADADDGTPATPEAPQKTPAAPAEPSGEPKAAPDKTPSDGTKRASEAAGALGTQPGKKLSSLSPTSTFQEVEEHLKTERGLGAPILFEGEDTTQYIRDIGTDKRFNVLRGLRDEKELARATKEKTVKKEAFVLPAELKPLFRIQSPWY